MPPQAMSISCGDLLLPIAVSFVLVYAAVAYLRWWPPVWVDDRPVQRWLIVVPLLMVVSIVIVTDYQGLADHGLTFVLLLLLTSLLVGFTEETMFRGIGVTCFRNNEFTEKKVALWSTVIFGLAHSTNLISEGPKAFIQVLTTIVAGYFSTSSGDVPGTCSYPRWCMVCGTFH